MDRPCFAGQELGVDEGNDTTLRYNYITKELVQSSTNVEQASLNWTQNSLLIVSNSELEVARDNTLFLKKRECGDETSMPFPHILCYHGRHFQQAQESRQQDTPRLPQDTLTKYINH